MPYLASICDLADCTRYLTADSPQYTKKAIDTLERVVAFLKSQAEPAKPTVDPRFISEVQPGYDTVLGYLAKHYPERLAMMDETPDATMRDGWALRGVCCKRRIVPQAVMACQFLQDHGIRTVNAYPIQLLQEHFGD